ncbi:aspartyl protease family protein [Robertkochia solimangrovi]|uniref:aspartyl protease family protein n=1 Tax=Robertkochia solimangrovi TaxID=2213046 RepID=UPI0013A5637D|nr:aspartyl protease family protein [Robertkochia solimangrovi]
MIMVLAVQLSCSAPKNKNALTAFESAFRFRDYETVKPLLADDFTISVYTGKSTESMFKSILKQYHQLDSLVEKNRNQNELGEKINATCYFKGQKPFLTGVQFDQQGKILYVDLLDQLYRAFRNRPSKKVATIPFEMIDGSIALEIKLNDTAEPFKMLFDTGADGMALSEAAASRANIKNIRDHQSSFVGSSSKVKFSSGNTIRLDSLEIPRQNLVVFPEIRGGFDGLFGGNFLSNYITRVDFDNGVIELFSFGQFEGKGKALSVDYTHMVPVFDAKLSIDGKKSVEGGFVFDTGAGYQIICFGPFVHENKLNMEFTPDYYSMNYSFGHPTRIAMGDIASVGMGDFTFDHVQGALQEYQEDNTEWAFKAGSVGIDLIKKFNFTVDLLHKVIYLEPNEMFGLPTDLTISGLQIGFERTGALVVREVVIGSEAAKNGIVPGTLITMINGIEAEELKNPDTMYDLRNKENSPYEIYLNDGERSMRITL